MRVKSKLPNLKASCVICIICGLGVLYLFGRSGKSGLILGLMIDAVLIAAFLREWVAFGRTFLFDETGCTVILGRYRKHYNWAELTAYEYRDYRIFDIYFSLGRRYYDYPDVRILFSVKKSRKLKRWRMEDYCYFFHPLSCIFVGYFHTKYEPSLNVDEIYLVPKEVVLEKLNEWNVEIQPSKTK